MKSYYLVTDGSNISKVVAPYSHVSFDLFDTLVYRFGMGKVDIRKLSLIYLSGLIYRALGSSISINELNRLRVKSTHDLKNSTKFLGHEPELISVLYEILCKIGLDDIMSRECALLVDVFESKLELDTLKPIEEMALVVAELKKQQKEIYIISDMYLSKRCIDTILHKNRLSEFVSKVFVSSDYGETKSEGLLYQQVLNQIGIDATEIIHIGDNFKSDVIQARRAQIKSLLYRGGKTNKQYKKQAKPVETWESVFVNFVTAFLHEIVIYCHLYQLRVVYFLSRDATEMGLLFSYLRDTNDTFRQLMGDMKVKFLSVSRTSIAFLDFDVESATTESVFKHYLAFRPNGFSLNELLLALGLDSEKYKPILEVRVDSTTDISSVITSIANTFGVEFEHKIIESAEYSFNASNKYLIQENVFSSGEIGLVDIGYRGSIARKLAIRINSDDGQKVKTTIHSILLMGGNGCCKSEVESLIITKPFLSEKDIPSLLRLNFSWFEIFFQSSTKGKLKRYYEENDHWHPDFELVLKGSNSSRNLMDVYNKKMVKEDVRLGLYFCESMRNKVKKEFVKKMAHPTRADIDIIAHIPFRRGLGDEETISIIRSEISIVGLFSLQRIRELTKHDIWILGSARSLNSWIVFPLSIWVYFCVNIIKLHKLFSRVMAN